MKNYHNLAGPRLQEILKLAAKTPPHLQLSLQEDLTMSRMTLGPLLEAYDKEVLDPDSKSPPGRKMIVAQMLRDALSAVREMSTAAAKVSTISERTFDADQLQYIFNRMRDILEKHIPPEAFDAALIELQEIVVPPKETGAKTGNAQQKALEVREALKKMDQQTASDNPF